MTGECTYLNRGRRCRQPAVGELDAQKGTPGWDLSGGIHEPGTPWPLCETHLQPEYHPPDLHKRLRRWPPGTVSHDR